MQLQCENEYKHTRFIKSENMKLLPEYKFKNADNLFQSVEPSEEPTPVTVPTDNSPADKIEMIIIPVEGGDTPILSSVVIKACVHPKSEYGNSFCACISFSFMNLNE